MFATTETSTLLIFGFLLLLATPADATPADATPYIDLTASQSAGAQYCSADGSWFACKISRCNQERTCASNPGLRFCACPRNPGRKQLYRWSSHKCPEDQHEFSTCPFSETKRLNLWNNRNNLFKVCTYGAITDVRLVGDVNARQFDMALEECSTLQCKEFKTGVHTGVGFGLALGSAIFSGLASTTGPVLGGIGALWSLVGDGSPSLEQIMSEVDRRVKTAKSQLSWTAIQADTESAVIQLQQFKKHASTPYDKIGNPRCGMDDVIMSYAIGAGGAVEKALTTTKAYVSNTELNVLHLEGVVKTLPLLADLLYAAYTNILGAATRLSCKGTYDQFRSGWERLLYLVELVETKYKTAKVCPDHPRGRPLSLREVEQLPICEVNQWKCYWKDQAWFSRVLYCGDDGFHGSQTCDQGSNCYSPNGVHFRTGFMNDEYKEERVQSEIAHVRDAFLDNQALLLDPIKEYIANLQKDVDQLCGYCSVRDSMIEPDRAVPVQIFLLASSQTYCTRQKKKNLPACVSTLKRTYKRPNQPADLENNERDFCGPTPDNTLGKELKKQEKKQKKSNNVVSICRYGNLGANWNSARKAGTTFLSHGDRIQPWSIFLLSIACLLWVFE